MKLPTLDDVAPWLLTTIGASAMHNLHARGYLEHDISAPHVPATLLKRNHNKRPDAKPRTYTSRYKGVTEHRGRWLAVWGPREDSHARTFPLTPEGEEQAAWAWALGNGLDAPVLRPPEQVRGTQEAAQALEARGQRRSKLGGKRIG